MNKPTILVFTGYYLPGYKSGGILRTLINTIDYLHTYFDFKIITRDRDLGDDQPYKDIVSNQWIRINNADVYYLTPSDLNFFKIANVIKNIDVNVVYLTSFFDKLSIIYLLMRRFNILYNFPTVLAPFGEFASASFSQKKFKKLLFLKFSKFTYLHSGILFRVSSDLEIIDLLKLIKIQRNLIKVAQELPRKHDIDSTQTKDLIPKLIHHSDNLKIIFLSRVSREKNLDYAISVLRCVKRQVAFDIYGPVENQDYWDECKILIKALPSNIQVSYRGTVHSDQVVNIFSQYDVFLFPTGGEAFGNVISESLLAGTPVLISDQTPWKNMEEFGFGWDLPLSDIYKFSEVIDNFQIVDNSLNLKVRNDISHRIKAKLFNDEILDSNLNLFLDTIDSRSI